MDLQGGAIDADSGAVQQVDEIFMALSAFAETAGEKVTTLKRASDFRYDKAPLHEVIADVSSRYNIPILIDTSALEIAGICTTEPITCALKGVRLHVALSEMLSPLRLTCHYKYEMLWITTPNSDLITGKDSVRVESGTPLAKELGRTVEISCPDLPLNDLLGDLSKRYGVRFINESNSNPPVTINIKGFSLRSALALLLRPDLYCEAKEGSLVIRKAQGERGKAKRGRGGGTISLTLGLAGNEQQVQKELGVDDNQKAAIQKLVGAARLAAPLRPTPAGSDAEREKLQKEAQEREKKDREDLSKILLPAQMARFEEIRLQISLQVEGIGTVLDPEVAGTLNLTDDQKSKLQTIWTECADKTRELNRPGGDLQGRSKKLAEFGKEAEAKAMAVLTDAQRKQWEDMKGYPYMPVPIMDPFAKP